MTTKNNASSEFFSPFKNNPLSNSLDIENFQIMGSAGSKSKENNNNINLFQEHFNNNEDVLATVTNFSSLGQNINNNLSNFNTNNNNKKENDKKKWMKRI